MFSSTFLLTPSTCRPCCGGLWALSAQLEPRPVTGDRACVGVLHAGPVDWFHIYTLQSHPDTYWYDTFHLPELCLHLCYYCCCWLYINRHRASLLEPVTDDVSDRPWVRSMTPPNFPPTSTTITNIPHELVVLISNTFCKHLSPAVAGKNLP